MEMFFTELFSLPPCPPPMLLAALMTKVRRAEFLPKAKHSTVIKCGFW
jgi:hypothetical protein